MTVPLDLRWLFSASPLIFLGSVSVGIGGRRTGRVALPLSNNAPGEFVYIFATINILISHNEIWDIRLVVDMWIFDKEQPMLFLCLFGLGGILLNVCN